MGKAWKWYVEVAVPGPMLSPFTYGSEWEVEPGCRVEIPFGRRKTIGVVVALLADPPGKQNIRLKNITRVIDSAPVFNKALLAMATFMVDYYCYPIGDIFRVMLPSAQVSKPKSVLMITRLGKEQMDQKTIDGLRLKEIFRGRVSLKLETALRKGCDISRFEARGYLEKVVTLAPRFAELKRQEGLRLKVNDKLKLTPEQEAAFLPLKSALDQGQVDTPYLLHGVTGAGKTEIYLQLIEVCFNQASNSQALVMVPEISLTPQMVRVFEARFPGIICVIHSGLDGKSRWQQMENMRSGKGRILVGPRSSVFAPFANLKLIIVDEEHDSSYKQTTGLCYNGRDMAVLRAKLEKSLVLLGSATPSMESMFNAKQGKYKLLRILKRVSGRGLPQIELIDPDYSRHIENLENDMQSDSEKASLNPVVLNALASNFASQQQSIVLVNRRGYAHFLFDLSEKKPVCCPRCSISLTVHGRNKFLRCHYCDYKAALSEYVGNEKQRFFTIGQGSQKFELLLQKKIPEAKIVRLDSDVTSSPGKLSEILSRFARREIDILLGTQMLAKGHDYPGVTLTVILEADQILNLPDFRAGEKAFQLIVQAAGRSGRGDHAGRVLIETSKSDHPIVKAAVRQDYDAFFNEELQFRAKYGYPPCRHMIAVELSATRPNDIEDMARKLERWVEGPMVQSCRAEVDILGPTVPAMHTLRGRMRRTLVLIAGHRKQLRQLTRELIGYNKQWPGDGRMKIDVDPQSLF